MSYLDRLKKSEKVGWDYPKEPKEFKKPNCLGLLGTLPVTFQKLRATETSYRWWQVHYPDLEPVQVWTSPPATMVEIMASRPDAIAAQSLHLDALKLITACSTCTHAIYRDVCAVPVAAGLSDLDGVIRYHDGGGKDCSAWQATIPDDLEALIKAAATFYQHSPDDFALIDEMKRTHPDGLRLVLETDPLRPFFTQKESSVEQDCTTTDIIGRLLKGELGT